MIVLVINVKQRGVPILNSTYGWSGMKHNEPYVLRTITNVEKYVGNLRCHPLVLPQLSVGLAVSEVKSIA